MSNSLHILVYFLHATVEGWAAEELEGFGQLLDRRA